MVDDYWCFFILAGKKKMEFTEITNGLGRHGGTGKQGLYYCIASGVWFLQFLGAFGA
jgi:hypothetical protein